jgi:hypothetical protein
MPEYNLKYVLESLYSGHLSNRYSNWSTEVTSPARARRTIYYPGASAVKGQNKSLSASISHRTASKTIEVESRKEHRRKKVLPIAQRYMVI